jgi:hypothetical protein
LFTHVYQSIENLQLSNQWLPSPLLLPKKQPDYAHQMKSAQNHAYNNPIQYQVLCISFWMGFLAVRIYVSSLYAVSSMLTHINGFHMAFSASFQGAGHCAGTGNSEMQRVGSSQIDRDPKHGSCCLYNGFKLTCASS